MISSQNISEKRLMPLLLLSTILLFTGCQRYFSPNFSILSVHALKGVLFTELTSDGSRQGGFSLLSSVVKAQRSGSDPVIFMVDNNSIHGTPAAYFSQGEYMVTMLNQLNCDVLIADSREFYFGTQRLAELAEMADFPIVSANIRLEDGRVPSYLKPYYYDRHNNILIIGLASPSLFSRNLPQNVTGLQIVPPRDAVIDAIGRFEREQGISVDAKLSPSVQRPFVIVNAVSHKLTSGGDSDILDSLQDMPVLDLLLVGERDLYMDGLIGGYQMTAEQYLHPRRETKGASFIATWGRRLVLIDDSRSDQGREVDVIKVAHSIPISLREIPLDSNFIEPDQSIGEQLFRIREQSELELSRQISFAQADFSHCYSGESELGALVSSAMQSYAGSDVALINSGAMRQGLPAGRISLLDAYRVLPFESALVTLELSGEQLEAVIEASVQKYGNSETEKGFLQSANLSYRIAETRNGYQLSPSGVLVNGQPLELQKIYRVTVTSYLYGGGDGYRNFSAVPVYRRHQETLLSVFIQHLEWMGQIAPSAQKLIAFEQL